MPTKCVKTSICRLQFSNGALTWATSAAVRYKTRRHSAARNKARKIFWVSAKNAAHFMRRRFTYFTLSKFFVSLSTASSMTGGGRYIYALKAGAFRPKFCYPCQTKASLYVSGCPQPHFRPCQARKNQAMQGMYPAVRRALPRAAFPGGLCAASSGCRKGI